MGIDLRDVDCSVWFVCVIPDSAERSLLLDNVDCMKVVFCKEIPEIVDQGCSGTDVVPLTLQPLRRQDLHL